MQETLRRQQREHCSFPKHPGLDNNLASDGLILFQEKILGGFPGCDRSVGFHNMHIRCSHSNLNYIARTRSVVWWLSSLFWWLNSLVWWLNSLTCWQFGLVWFLNSPFFIDRIERDVFRSQQGNGVVVGNTRCSKTRLKKCQTAITINNIILRRLKSLQDGLLLGIVQ